MTIDLIVPLTQGKFALVSMEDYDFLIQWKWHAVRIKNTAGDLWYAIRYAPGNRNIRMHREVARRAGLPESPRYDHADHDGLNNRRENIRPATPNQNNANSRKRSNATSQFKGVVWHRCSSKWRAQITCNRKVKHLGLFINEQDAAAAYAAEAREKFGEFSFQQSISMTATP